MSMERSIYEDVNSSIDFQTWLRGKSVAKFCTRSDSKSNAPFRCKTFSEKMVLCAKVVIEQREKSGALFQSSIPAASLDVVAAGLCLC
jgi:hypothetical protein